MAFQISWGFVNEDTGVASSYLFNANVYETSALPMYLARKDDCGDVLSVHEADKSVYVKPAKRVDDYSSDPYRYGSPEHQAFGDAWLYADCEGAW